MSIGRVVGLLLLVVVVYAVITQPTASAAMTRDGVGHLGDAGTSLTTFMSALVGGDADSSGVESTSQVDRVPQGGVGTGDGSYPG